MCSYWQIRDKLQRQMPNDFPQDFFESFGQAKVADHIYDPEAVPGAILIDVEVGSVGLPVPNRSWHLTWEGQPEILWEFDGDDAQFAPWTANTDARPWGHVGFNFIRVQWNCVTNGRKT